MYFLLSGRKKEAQRRRRHIKLFALLGLAAGPCGNRPFPPASNSRVISQSVKKRCVPFPPRILCQELSLSPKFSLLLFDSENISCNERYYGFCNRYRLNGATRFSWVRLLLHQDKTRQCNNDKDQRRLRSEKAAYKWLILVPS